MVKKTVKQSSADSHNPSPVEQILSEEHLFSQQESSTTSYNLYDCIRGGGGCICYTLLQLLTTRICLSNELKIKENYLFISKLLFFCIKKMFI